MTFKTFVHADHGSPTTLTEVKRVYDLVEPSDFCGGFAYATQSGVASFDLVMGKKFWEHTPSRWLFGLDYGRTHPAALRRICERDNAEVKIVDGAWVVAQDGFLPRRDFHAKLSILSNPEHHRYGMVVGSGNFSANGLRRSIEAGSAFYSEDEKTYFDCIGASVALVKSLWEDAIPAGEILESYEEAWDEHFSVKHHVELGDPVAHPPNPNLFWIEAGYVTRNRGLESPGNQIDFPRGMSKYFGFEPPVDLPIKSIIGEIRFLTPVGDSVTRNLRLGNNHMEKITLPIPETHGFDMYDGKILLFRRDGNAFVMSALEVDDFDSVFGGRLAEVKTMGSGRRYGYIK